VFENDGVTISQIWDHIDTSVAGVLNLYLKEDLENPSDYIYLMRCENFFVPTDTLKLQGFEA
jgi:hypothetical protein